MPVADARCPAPDPQAHTPAARACASARMAIALAGVLTLLLLLPATALAEDNPLFAIPEHVPESARDTAAPVGDRPMARTALLLDREQAAPGERVRVGVHFTMEPGWHIYWRNSGQSGYPSEVDFAADALPDDAFGPLLWPAPRAFEEGGGFIITYGYGGTVVLGADLIVPEDAEGTLELNAVADFLICEVDCIPGITRMSRSLAIGPAEPTPAEEIALLDASRDRLPVTAPDRGWSTEVALAARPLRPGDTVRATLGLVTCDGPPEDGAACPELALPDAPEHQLFIPDAMEGTSVAFLGAREHPSAYAGRLFDLELTAGPDRARDDTFSGVLRLLADGEPVALDIAAPLPRGDREAAVETLAHPFFLDVDPDTLTGEASSASAPRPLQPLPWWQALLFAFLGGMLLNLMPCVFPILAIKVYGLAELAHESRSRTVLSGVAYTAGIVGSLLLLALVVVGLRAGGTAVGWGFQFQEPLFIAFVGAVLVLFAANLFGAFEIGVSASRLDAATARAHGLRRSFFEGILAVILATPCSAPFLGAAVGFALAGSAPLILAIFAVLGLGLAIPYVLLTLMPQWGRWLPRPGPWMDHFRRFLGFVLLGTTVWLLWIVGQSTGSDGMTRLLVFLVACALAAWIYGLFQHAASRGWRVGGHVLAIALLLAVAAVTLRFGDGTSASPADGPTTSAGITWEVFDEHAIAQVLEGGQPVFVDFTADWCITCKFNERTVINTDRVREAIATHDVVMFKADWTRRDDRIREVLARFGKAGVPMYLTYSPAAPDDPEVLPELLTADRLITSFARAAGTP